MKNDSTKGNDSPFAYITAERLKQMAGERFFDRGVNYYEWNHVLSLGIDGGLAKATVEGTEDYTVIIQAYATGINGHCTCPAYAESGFCKHCVAVGLALIDLVKCGFPANASTWTYRDKVKAEVVIMDDLRASLKQLDKNSLVEIIAKQAWNDERFRERLKIKTVKPGPDGKIEIEWLKEAIARAVSIPGCYEYDSLNEHVEELEEAIENIEELLKKKHYEEVVRLSEHVFNTAEKLFNEVCDHGGDMDDVLERLLILHSEGCKIIKPDQEQLAHKLLDWEKRFGLDILFVVKDTYNPVLGKKGLKIYRELTKEDERNVE
jgi:uncharacterized Zn finger protein